MTFLRIVISLSLLVEHDLFRKPVSTFRDHALLPAHHEAVAAHFPALQPVEKAHAEQARPELTGLCDQCRHFALEDGADGHAVERDGRRAGAPICRLDVDVVRQKFERQAGGLGGLLGQHDRTGASIEHHRDVGAIDHDRYLEIAAAGARDLDACAALRGPPGNEFGQDTIADFAQLDTVGISGGEKEGDHHPEHGGFERLPESVAEQGQHEAAEEDDERNLDRQRSEVVGLQTGDRAGVVADDEDEKREPEAEKQEPEETTAAHGIPLAWSAAASFAAARRATRRGSSAMRRARSSAVSALHCAISSSVRPQPTHSREAGSMVQTWVQGVWMDMVFGDSPGNIKAAAQNAIVRISPPWQRGLARPWASSPRRSHPPAGSKARARPPARVRT